MFCDWASREIETNASLRSRTEKWEVPEGIVERSVEPSSLDHSIVHHSHCSSLPCFRLMGGYTPVCVKDEVIVPLKFQCRSEIGSGQYLVEEEDWKY